MNLSSFGSVSTSEQEIQENATISALPFYFHPLLAAEFVGVKKLATFNAMFVNEFGNFHVETTIFSDFHDAFFTPPFDRVNSVGGLAQAKGCLCDIFQS